RYCQTRITARGKKRHLGDDWDISKVFPWAKTDTLSLASSVSPVPYQQSPNRRIAKQRHCPLSSPLFTFLLNCSSPHSVYCQEEQKQINDFGESCCRMGDL